MTSGTMKFCHCIVCHTSSVLSVIPSLYQQRESKIENCSGNGDRSSINFFDRPKINYSTGFITLSHFTTCSAISYSNDNQHMLPRKWYQGQRSFETLTLNP